MSDIEGVTEREFYDNLKKKFGDVYKKILNYKPNNKDGRKLPSDPIQKAERVNVYKTELVTSYNAYVSFVDKGYTQLQSKSKLNVRERLQTFKRNVLEALTVLELFVDLPTDFEPIDIDTVISNKSVVEVEQSQIFVRPCDLTAGPSTSDDSVEPNLNQSSQQDNFPTQPLNLRTTDNFEHESDNDLLSDTDNFTGNSPDGIENDWLNTEKMERPQFLSLMAANIPQNYAGDPMALRPFIASIDYLYELADSDALKTLLKKFILTKLEGLAAEIVPAEPASVKAIVGALSAKIKPENSKVIEGRMMALRADRGNLQDYAKKVEELSDSFRRALVADGIPLAKAEEMTIDKTIDLCRANAQNQVVKAVLASTKFETPKEVVAKFVVESNTSRQEAQVLSYQRFQNRNHGRRNGNGNGNFRGNGQNNGYRNHNRQQNGNRNSGGRSGNWRGGNRNGNHDGNRNQNGYVAVTIAIKTTVGMRKM